MDLDSLLSEVGASLATRIARSARALSTSAPDAFLASRLTQSLKRVFLRPTVLTGKPSPADLA